MGNSHGSLHLAGFDHWFCEQLFAPDCQLRQPIIARLEKVSNAAAQVYFATLPVGKTLAQFGV